MITPFANLEKVALATARYFGTLKKRKNGVLIGYDARFMSREFAEVSAAVMANAGIAVQLADSIVSTPMVSLLTLRENAAGGSSSPRATTRRGTTGSRSKGTSAVRRFPG